MDATGPAPSDGEEQDHGGRREAVERSRRVGPVVYRLQAVRRVLVLLAAWAVLGAAVGTVTGFYHGMNKTPVQPAASPPPSRPPWVRDVTNG